MAAAEPAARGRPARAQARHVITRVSSPAMIRTMRDAFATAAAELFDGVDHARCVAERLTGTVRSYTAMPWFWTHQYDLTLQVAGLVAGHDTAVPRGDPDERSYSVFSFTGTRLLGVESVNRPSDHLLARALLAGAHSPTPDIVSAPRRAG